MRASKGFGTKGGKSRAIPVGSLIPALTKAQNVLDGKDFRSPKLRAILDHLLEHPLACREDLRTETGRSVSWITHVFPDMVKAGYCQTRRVFQMALAEGALFLGYSETEVALVLLQRASVSGFVGCFKECHNGLTPVQWQRKVWKVVNGRKGKIELPEWLETRIRKAFQKKVENEDEK